VTGPSRFVKQRISHEAFEAAGVFDVDGDGHLDIVSGGWWYAGPDFLERHPVCEVDFDGSYYDDFSVIVMDIAGDGRLDVVTGGWDGETLRWRRNPGVRGEQWDERVIARVGNIETTRAWDVDGDGVLEIVPNTPNDPLRSYKLVGPGQFAETVHRDGPSGHGLGFGDVYGDGRGRFVLASGIVDPLTGELEEEIPLAEHFEYGYASVPILVQDVDGDGQAELIVGAAHGYGLDWWKREDGGWRRRSIDAFNSQYHDLAWADVDRDGACELISGKRYRAHGDDDPGALDPFALVYFKWAADGWVKQPVDAGPGLAGQGIGIQFAVADLDGNGFPDIVVPGKDGLTLYRNRGPA
jgi:hypothetical protein